MRYPQNPQGNQSQRRAVNTQTASTQSVGPQQRGGWSGAPVGIAGIWLRLTSSGWQRPPQTFAERDFVRRSQLASWLFLGLLVAGVIFLSAGQTDIPTLIAIIGAILSVVVACILNRFGQVTIAALIVIAVLMAAIFGADLSAPGGQLAPDYLASYDLLVLPVLVAAALLPPIVTFILVGVNSALIIVDFLALQTYSPDLAQEISADGLGLLLGRPIGLEVATAAIVFLLVRGIIENARRADRAEELAALEGAIADQKRQLDVGVQQILATHVRAANGDYAARAPLGQDNVLFAVAASLNNLLARLQRSGQFENQLRRTESEARRLAAALDEARVGRRPAWPTPSGTVIDELIGRVNPNALPSPGLGFSEGFSDPGRGAQAGQYGYYSGPFSGPTGVGGPSGPGRPLAPNPPDAHYPAGPRDQREMYPGRPAPMPPMQPYPPSPADWASDPRAPFRGQGADAGGARPTGELDWDAANPWPPTQDDDDRRP